MSQITTHILDTTSGKPAKGVSVSLFEEVHSLPGTETIWREIAIGTTDNEGRIMTFLSKGTLLSHAIYKMRFETKEYFERQALQSFYPFIEITFTITTDEHYHIPLLLNPFGFSTYRGT
jgi:5-hydroxyisourate hydrolase